MKNIRYHNLSLYRVLAPISIFTFHIFYIYYANLRGLYGILSSAVQGFTFLSALLYSQKEIQSVPQFLKKNIWKIVLPALIALGYMLLVNVIVMFAKGDISWQAFINTWCDHRVDGNGLLVQFGNYWYVFLISACYCILPILQKLYKTKGFAIFVLGVVLLDLGIALGFGNSLLFSPFVLGYAFGKKAFNHTVDSSYHRFDIIMIVLFLCISLGILWVYDVATSSTASGFMRNLLGLAVSTTHCIFGMSLFLFIVFTFKFLNRFQFPNRIFRLTDKVSYSFFLGHESLMTGAMSSFFLTNIFGVDYLIVLVFAIIFALVIYYTEYLIHHLSKKRKLNNV